MIITDKKIKKLYYQFFKDNFFKSDNNYKYNSDHISSTDIECIKILVYKEKISYNIQIQKFDEFGNKTSFVFKIYLYDIFKYLFIHKRYLKLFKSYKNKIDDYNIDLAIEALPIKYRRKLKLKKLL